MNVNRPSLIPFLILLLLAPTLVAAQTQERTESWHGVVSLGLTFGGDELVTVRVDRDFSGEDDESIKAGELVQFAGGFLYEKNKFQLQTTLGYYVDGIFGENGETSFTRWPIEVLAFWKTDKLRLGTGITHHLNPEFELDIDYEQKIEVDFDDATGFIIQGDYLIIDSLALGLRFTNIEYEEKDTGSKVDGDSVGLILSYIF